MHALRRASSSLWRPVVARGARALHQSASRSHGRGRGTPGCADEHSHGTAGEFIRTRAAVARSPSGALAIESLLLRAPCSDEVLVRLAATGLCHTDVAVKERNLCAFPAVLGHEGAGIVERVGSSISSLKPGDRVLLSYASCGTCPHCLLGRPSYCFEHGSLNFGGADRSGGKTLRAEQPQHEEVAGSFFQQSSFAQYALASENNIVKVPASASALDLALLAPLGCGIQTGAGAVLNSLKPGPMDSLAVFGAGAVGLSAVLGARLAGVRDLVAVDRNPRRLALAKKLGARHTVLVDGSESEKEVAERVRAAVNRSLDFSLDTTGNPRVLRSAFDCTRALGVCALVGGAAPGVEVKVDMLGLLPGKVLRGVIQGDAVPQRFLPQLVSAFQSGDFPYDQLVTFYSGLDQLNQAISDVKDAQGTVIKPVVRIE